MTKGPPTCRRQTRPFARSSSARERERCQPLRYLERCSAPRPFALTRFATPRPTRLGLAHGQPLRRLPGLKTWRRPLRFSPLTPWLILTPWRTWCLPAMLQVTRARIVGRSRRMTCQIPPSSWSLLTTGQRSWTRTAAPCCCSSCRPPSSPARLPTRWATPMIWPPRRWRPRCCPCPRWLPWWEGCPRTPWTPCPPTRSSWQPRSPCSARIPTVKKMIRTPPPCSILRSPWRACSTRPIKLRFSRCLSSLPRRCQPTLSQRLVPCPCTRPRRRRQLQLDSRRREPRQRSRIWPRRWNPKPLAQWARPCRRHRSQSPSAACCCPCLSSSSSWLWPGAAPRPTTSWCSRRGMGPAQPPPAKPRR